MKIYQALAGTIGAYRICLADPIRHIWVDRHRERIMAIVATGPSGAGWDSGTKIDVGKSTKEKIVFYGSFHHMDDAGSYDGWTNHDIVVTPSLAFDVALRISGENRNDIKEYLHEMFHTWLIEDCQEQKPTERKESSNETA